MTTYVETVGKFTRTNEIAGTCLQGYIEATREQLETVFGTPGDGDGGYKFFFDWGIDVTERDGQKTIATIYEWKYERKVDLTETITWNIGGNSSDAVRVIQAILCEQLQMTAKNFNARLAR
jgi:hypothetical protein